MTGESHSRRFASLNNLLRREGDGLPRLLIDLDCLDRNIDQAIAYQAATRLRLVAKSLPATGLLEYIAARLWGSTTSMRLMVFHLPFLQQLIHRFPGADILMGKPLPIMAMAGFYRNRPASETGAIPQIQWLVDTRVRLEQVASLAAQIRHRISINLELDIGMHRGGIDNLEELKHILEMIRSNIEHVQLCGFMGYDAHAAKAPWPRSTLKACERSAEKYAALLKLGREIFPELEESPWCINGAGSPTLSLHDASSPLNDFSIGSALIKPAGFDVPSLENFKAACWIATPVLKRLQGVDIPFLEKVPSGGRDSLFIYGGRWMATPVSPPGLQENKLYGLSSNQQMLTVEANCGITVDDYVFLRPSQSEAVLLQFGDILAVRANRIFAHWPVLKNELGGEPAPAGSDRT